MRINTTIGNVGIRIDTQRLGRNLAEAQKFLNMQIVADCDPLIPFRQGALRNSINYPQGIYGGEIEWNAPYAHYQYAGEVYGPNIPRFDSEGHLIGWYSPKGKKKHPTGRKLEQHTDGTTAEWFEVAKKQHGKDWERLVRETAGRG